MGKHITPTMVQRSLVLLRASLPIDTGNLRFNATKSSYFLNGFYLYVSGMDAPYFELLDGTGRSQQYIGNFNDLSFTPVFRYLENEMGGKFAGGRFLQQKNVLEYTSKMNKVINQQQVSNLSARDTVARRF